MIGVGRDEQSPRGAVSAELAAAVVGASHKAADILDEIDRAGVAIVSAHDPAYPARLRATELPPHVLFVRGEPSSTSARSAIAVVGTRRASEAGRLTAARIGGAISRAGGVVISGLATGIDGAAHAAVVSEGRS